MKVIIINTKIYLFLIIIYTIINIVSSILPLDQHNEVIKILLENVGIKINEPCDSDIFIYSLIDDNKPDLGHTITEIKFDHVYVDLQFKIEPPLNISRDISSDLSVEIFITTNYSATCGENVTLPQSLKSIYIQSLGSTSVPEYFFKSNSVEKITITKRTNDDLKFPIINSQNNQLKYLNIPIDNINSISIDNIGNNLLSLTDLSLNFSQNYRSDLPEFNCGFKSLESLVINFRDTKQVFNIPRSLNSLPQLKYLTIIGLIKVDESTPIIDVSNFNNGLSLSMFGEFSTIPKCRPLVLLPRDSSLSFFGLSFPCSLIDFTNVTSITILDNKYKQPYPYDDTMNNSLKYIKIGGKQSNIDGHCPKNYYSFTGEMVKLLDCFEYDWYFGRL